MKGLIRNNFYNINQIVYGGLGLMGLTLLWLIISNLFIPKATVVNDMLILACTTAFSASSYSLLQNNSMCKWDKFELTTPVNKTDVMLGRYITFLICAIIPVVFFLVSELVVVLTGTPFDLNNFTFTLAFVLIIAFMVPAIYHPLVIKFGIDKGQLFYMLAMMGSIALYIAPTFIFSGLIVALNMTDLTYRILMISIALLLFVVSFVSSRKIYINKDL